MRLHFLEVAAITYSAMLLAAGLLHLIPRLGRRGRQVSEMLCRAPALDLLIAYFTVAPLIFGPVVGGWRGFIAAIVGGVTAMLTWQVLHELANPEARRGPRIIKFTNQLVGRVRNHTAVWCTALVLPGFSLVRLSEWIVYPPLTWLVGLPKYNSGEWVNVSRHKFEGLVGHDLIWCLYCDWMTGVWSLGTEMLRNVESFWCPIRFTSGKKCANCTTDFPDLDNGWVPATGTMADVTETLAQMYPKQQRERAWFGHPVRVTVQGREVPFTRQAVQPVGTLNRH